MDQVFVVELLGRSTLFAPLSEGDRQAIATRMRRVRFEPRQSIFARGDPGRDIYLVLEGRVRLSVVSSGGRELSLDHASAGDIFGEIATLGGGVRTAGAIAMTHVQAMALSQRALMETLAANTNVALAAIRFLCTRLRETDQKLESVAFHRVEVRVARLMVSALKLRDPQARGENVRLDLGMSQGELALLVGASRPKVNAALAALEGMGAIRRAGAAFVCNVGPLEQVADTDD